MTEPTEKELDNFEQELMMEEQDELAIALLIDSVPPSGKCEHGVYIAKGDTFALYCTICNPQHCGIIAPLKRLLGPVQAERTIDTAEYLKQPLSERLAFAAQLEDIAL